MVVAVETAQAPTFSEAIKAGRLVKLDKVSTVANSLASPYISEQSLVNYKNYKTNLELIDDLDALKGTLEYYDNFNGGTVEPACGAAISTVTNRKDLLDKLDLQKDDIVVVIVCGGLGISEEIIEEYREKVK